MALEKIIQVSGRGVHVPGADIDTDRIIPARYLKCVTFDGLGQYAFYDVRFNPETGEKTGHPLDDPRFAGASIMLVGSNFGCGSSREHAPQSLQRFGIRAMIGESFAEIFFGNSTALGMPCVILPAADIHQLASAVEQDPATEITINLMEKKVKTSGGLEFDFTIAESAREAFLDGQWDPLAELLANSPKIEAVADALYYT